MDNETHVIKAGSTTHGQFGTDVSIERVGWERSSIRVLVLPAGRPETMASGVSELLVLPLSGGCAVEVNGETHVLNGHEEVWSAITDYLYIPHGTMFTVRSESGGQFALLVTKATCDLSVRHYFVTGAITTLHGADPHSHQANNCALGNDPETSHLLACEMLTPDDNWSSHSPHKHDEHSGAERTLEETYCYKVRSGLNGSPGMALQYIYPSSHDIDMCAEMYFHDVVTMPHGYHGPSVTTPGYDLYYLNATAGPAEDFAWLMTDDLAYTWIHDIWVSQDVDPRLPMTPLN